MTCLDFAEREKIQGLKNLNVPNLRFPEFTEEWTQCTIGSYGNIITGSTPSTSDTENYDNGTYLWASPTDLGELKYVEQTQTKLTDKGFGKTRRFPANSIMVTCIGSTIGKMGMSKVEMSTNQQINTIVPTGHDANFVFYTIQSRFPRYLSSIAVQAVPIISKSAFEKLENYTTSIDEEVKIGTFLSLLDERIATQIKIIQQLQSLIKGIRVRLFSFDNYDIKYLGDLCSITTGKLDANAMVENGKYPFFTCAEDTFRIDEYAFDTEALLISGNGANLGYIHYYNGKFNAYQRTYVLDKFSVEVMYLKYYLETFLNQRINQEVNVGNTPYIVLSTLTKMKIKIPDISLQRNIINVLSNLNLKLNQEKDILSAYQTQKAYLLRNLFI